MNEDKATRFHRLRRRAELAATLAAGGLLGFLLLAGPARTLADAVGRLAGILDTPVASRALAITAMIVAVGVLYEAATFPWLVYRGFVLERRFGRSCERLADWLRGHLVALALGLVFAVAGGLTIYASMSVWPGSWWLPATAAFGAVSIMMTYGAPTVVMPLFYRFTPRVRDALRERLLTLADRAGTRVIDVHEWHLGAKSRAANAALVGLVGTRRILISDTMLEGFSDEEIEVILAHELAHHVHRDIWAGLAVEVAKTGLGLFVAQSALHWLGPILGLAGPSDLAGLPLMALSVGAVGMATAPAVHAMSRALERRADRFALDLTGNADAFVSAMRRLGAQHLAEEQPSRVVEVLFHTHPPLSQRLAAARAWQALRRDATPAEYSGTCTTGW